MQFIESSIALSEVAKLTKRSAAEIEAEATELDIFVGVDWAGRPAIAQRDARAIATGEARRVRESEAVWAAHLAACAAWNAGRDAAVRAAHDAVGADPRQGPEKHSQAREAAVEAGRRYEQTTPVPLWQGTESGNAVRNYSTKPEGLLKRAAGRVKAGAR